MMDSNYWATAAQTMPVLALATVVEARAIITRWTPGEARVYKCLIGIIWSIPLIAYGFAIPACFRALADERVWSGWPQVINASMSLSLGTLVGTPALELIARTNARLYSGAIFLIGSRFLPVQRWRAARRVAKHKRTLMSTDQELAELEARVNAFEARAHLIDNLMGNPENEEYRAAPTFADEARSEISRKRSYVRQVLEELNDIESSIQRNRERTAAILEELEASTERDSDVANAKLKADIESIEQRTQHIDESAGQGSDDDSNSPPPPSLPHS